MKTKKTYVLDTNVLMDNPSALVSFDEHDVVITGVTLEELDKNKNKDGERGMNAREAIRLLDQYTNGCTKEVSDLPGGGKLKIVVSTASRTATKDYLPADWDPKFPDNKILYECVEIKLSAPDMILVTNDTAMRIKAGILGIKAESYKTNQVVELHEQYKGRYECLVKSGVIEELYRDRFINASEIISEYSEAEPHDFVENEFVILKDEANLSHSALGRYTKGNIVTLQYDTLLPCNVSPRNSGQHFALEALLAPASVAPLVILKGNAGTAKTFLSLAAGLHQVLSGAGGEVYKRILVARPNIKFDEDIGYLKGTEEDKVGPLMRPIWDNLETLTAIKKDSKFDKAGTSYTEYLVDKGLIVMQALAYMRGRSITDTYIIIDEAQNMSSNQAFGIISRAGCGSKIILAGDVNQIDNPHLSTRNNGLSFASERMKGNPLCWQVEFTDNECVRSDLAKEAIKFMQQKNQVQE